MSKTVEEMTKELMQAGIETGAILQAIAAGQIKEFYEKACKKIKDLPLIEDRINTLKQENRLNKQELNCLGLWIFGDWQRFTRAKSQWLKSLATLVQEPETIKFLASEKSFNDVESFLNTIKKGAN